MDDREKLKHLLSHWQEHNKEHAETYRKWAHRMEETGERGAGKILEHIADKTEELNVHFQELQGLLD